MREGLVVACAGMKRTDPCVSSGIELPRNSGYSRFRGLAAQAASVMEASASPVLNVFPRTCFPNVFLSIEGIDG